MVGLADEGESVDDNTLSSYEVSIHLHGDKSSELKALLRSVSTAVADVKSPPPTVTLLKAIAKSDISKMAKVLQSYSFYAGTVKIYFKEKEDPLRLIFSVTTGKPFLLNEITIDISGPGLPADIIPPNIEETGLKQGARGTALSIIDGGDNLLVNLRKLGYPFAEMADRKVVVDYATQMIDVTFAVSPGERAVFGKTTITGLEDVDEEFVRSKIPWKEGWYYDPNLIQKFRNRVSRAGLFTMVLIDPITKDPTGLSLSPTPTSSQPQSTPAGAGATPTPPTPESARTGATATSTPPAPDTTQTGATATPAPPLLDLIQTGATATSTPLLPDTAQTGATMISPPPPPESTPPDKSSSPPRSRTSPETTDTSGTAPLPLTLPVNITVRERKRHTVALMAGYSTDLGFGGGASWEDRNLFGGGESLQMKLFASEKLYLIESRFMLPEFLSPEQSLILGIQPVYDNPDAYTSYRVRGSAIVRRDISGGFSFSGGAALTTDRAKQLDRTENYILGSMPLNAQMAVGGQQPFRRAGALFSLLGEPYWDFTNDRVFIKTLLNINLLYRFPGNSGSLAVGRISFGSIPGASQGEVPADLRFYAGGANSIRGYGYQIVGPMVGDKPVGGRSLLTFSLEFNQKIIGDFGAAAFLDGGSAFAHDLPRSDDEILWGTGAGLRYFTPIGPIGLDFGIPLNKRKGIDDDFQVYVSIAQIF